MLDGEFGAMHSAKSQRVLEGSAPGLRSEIADGQSRIHALQGKNRTGCPFWSIFVRY